MAVTQTKSLGRLAHLTLGLKARWELYAELLGRAEAAERLGLVVAGERSLVGELDGLLQEASDVLSALGGQGGPGVDLAARLGELETITADALWEFAADVSAQLAEKEAAQRAKELVQQDLAKNLQNQVREWSARIRDLTEKVDGADKAYAPIYEERRTVQRLDALVKRAERDLGDGQYTTAGEALRKLEEDAVNLPNLLDGVKKKLDEVRPIARQADLLLIRSPLAMDRYQYTLFLRTPRDPGVSGIDIQDESTVVVQDHQFFEDAMKEITAQVNAGLVRSFSPPQTGTVGAAGAQAGAPGRAGAKVEGAAGAAEAGRPAGDAAGAPVEEPAGEVRGAVSVAGTPAPAQSVAASAAVQGVQASEDTIRLRMVSAPAPQSTRPARELVEEIGDLIYRLVVPEGMQRFLTETRSSLTIRTNDVELPWELMRVQGRDGPETLCLERPVARMPAGRAYPRRETTRKRDYQELRFLLIYSDPEGNLPAAGREIEQIANGLPAALVKIDTLLPGDVPGKKLNKVLIEAGYDVIHYAGHAFFDAKDPDLSGLVLKGSELFFAQKVRRLLEGRPLVFLNACESGRTANETAPQQLEGYLQKPAEGITSAFIYGGAASCIGSIWPVYDQPAAEFAISFYKRVIDGYMVGEALRQARLESRRNHPEQITWASFVLYGDPTARLAT